MRMLGRHIANVRTMHYFVAFINVGSRVMGHQLWVVETYLHSEILFELHSLWQRECSVYLLCMINCNEIGLAWLEVSA